MAGRTPITSEIEPAFLAAVARRELRDQAMVILGMNTGFRATELLSLDVGQVWTEGRVKPSVTIQRRAMKHGQGPYRKSVNGRTVPLNLAATTILERYLFARFGSGPADPKAPLFPSRKSGKKLTRWMANEIVHQIAQDAGIADRGLFGTHSWRKTFAAKIFLATGRDLNLTRAVMGHRHASTTVAYLSVNDADVASAVLRIGEMAPPQSAGELCYSAACH